MEAFLSNFWTVSQQVIILFILIGVGFLCAKRKVINEEGSKQLSQLLFSVVNVCIIVDAFLSIEYNPTRLKEMGIMVLCCILTTLVGLILVFPLFRNTDRSKKSVLRFATIFSNCGFMSIPLAKVVLGDEGVFLVSIFMAVFQILVWTLGIAIFNTGVKLNIRSILLNPGVVGVVIGIPLFLLQVKVPLIISSPIDFLAALNTPLAMIIMGFCMSKTRFVPEKSDVKILICSGIRLVLVPVIIYFIFSRIFRVSGVLLCACMIPAAAPSAANTAVFANMFNRDVVLSSRTVSICTLLSIITLPVFTAISQL